MTIPLNPQVDANLPHPRERWMVGLAACDRRRLAHLATHLAERYEAQHTAVPMAGLGLLRLYESVHGDPFHLGEFTLSTASVELTVPTGDKVYGAAGIMADDAGLAVSLAVCDAVLAHRLPGWHEVAELLQQGLDRLEQQAKMRKSMLARTQVHFSMLNEA